jgi:hypothetical protein
LTTSDFRWTIFRISAIPAESAALLRFLEEKEKGRRSKKRATKDDKICHCQLSIIVAILGID